MRGYDAKLGWLHAVAHGADLLGVLGRHAQVGPERMLALAARRMLADSDYVWRDQEDDRLGYAIALTLGRPDLTAAQATGWLDLIDERFATGKPGPVPPYASNTIRTLRAAVPAGRPRRSGRADAPILSRCRIATRSSSGWRGH